MTREPCFSASSLCLVHVWLGPVTHARLVAWWLPPWCLSPSRSHQCPLLGCSYQRVKGISHSVEERSSKHSQNPMRPASWWLFLLVTLGSLLH